MNHFLIICLSFMLSGCFVDQSKAADIEDRSNNYSAKGRAISRNDNAPLSSTSLDELNRKAQKITGDIQPDNKSRTHNISIGSLDYQDHVIRSTKFSDNIDSGNVRSERNQESNSALSNAIDKEINDLDSKLQNDVDHDRAVVLTGSNHTANNTQILSSATNSKKISPNQSVGNKPSTAAQDKAAQLQSIPTSQNKVIKFLKPIHGTITNKFDNKLKGVNIMSLSSGNVVSASDGLVLYAERDSQRGNLVIISFASQNLNFAYANLKSISVKKDDIVKTGDVIGSIDKNQLLYIAVQDNKKIVDPLRYIGY